MTPAFLQRAVGVFFPILLVQAFVLVAGCEHEKEATPPPPPPEVMVMPAASRDVAISREWLGTTDGLVNAEVRSRVQGYLIAQHYTEGSAVKKGDLLYEVDPRPLKAVVSQAKADLAQAMAEQARSELDVNRLAPLAPSGAVSQQEVDNARQLNEANRARVEAAKAAVEQAELDLEFARIVSPIDGVAGISQAQIGDLVGGVGGPVMTTISTLDPIRVFFPISEQEYLRFEREVREERPRRDATPEAHGGSPEGSVSARDKEAREPRISLILADGSVYPHKGRLDVVNREVDATTGTIRLAAIFANPRNLLRPGQYAKVRADVGVRKGAVLVPQRCVVDLQGKYFVGVVGGDNKASLRAVELGERIGSEWVVTKGLSAGEKVVVEGVQKVRDGAEVSPKPYEPPAAAAGAKQGAAESAAPSESGDDDAREGDDEEETH